MKINGTQLDTEAGLIKARSGSYGNGLFRYSNDDYAIYAGGLKFPLAPLNRFTPAMNGICNLLDGKFTIALDYMLHTPNVISFELDADLGEGQQVSYTIQHGERSVVLTNSASQKITIAFDTGKPVIITAINYATGATKSETLYPTAGSAYKLASVSITRVEGELKTVGGETTGEVKTVCTQEAFVFDATSPVLKKWQGVLESFTKTIAIGAVSAPALNEVISNIYVDAIAGTNNSGVFPGDETGQFIKKYNEYLLVASAPTVYWRSNVGSSKEVLQQYFTPTQGGVYSILSDTNETLASKLWEYNSAFATFYLEKDKTYIGAANIFVEQPKMTIVEPPTELPNGSWGATIAISTSMKGEFTIYGPLEKRCVAQQVIDTRVTTPVITTDTRRTIHEIFLTITPLN